MSAGKGIRLNTQIYEEASEWIVEFRSGDIDASARQRFNAWLRLSPEHVRAYLEIAAIWNEGGSMDAGRRYDEASLIASVPADDNVVSIGAEAKDPAATAPQIMLSKVSRIALAASLVLAAAVAWVWFNDYKDVYSTSVGEQSSIALIDGSTVEMNSRSRVRVRFTQTERDIELIEGQALFRVAKDKSRPFIVSSGNTSIRAVGTQFDVYRKKSGTIVTVVEGRVAILSSADQQAARAGRAPAAPRASPFPPAKTLGASLENFAARDLAVFLDAGEQITVQRAGTDLPRPIRTNIAAVTAWTQRRLILESASLADVAEEFNRYNASQIVIDDAGLNDFHISGVFSSTDPASLIKFLRTRRGINVTETEKEIHVSRP